VQTLPQPYILISFRPYISAPEKTEIHIIDLDNQTAGRHNCPGRLSS
jgi:hypothetical protein